MVKHHADCRTLRPENAGTLRRLPPGRRPRHDRAYPTALWLSRLLGGAAAASSPRLVRRRRRPRPDAPWARGSEVFVWQPRHAGRNRHLVGRDLDQIGHLGRGAVSTRGGASLSRTRARRARTRYGRGRSPAQSAGLASGRRRYRPLNAAEDLLCVANRLGIDSPQAFNADPVEIVVVKQEHEIATAVASDILKGSGRIALDLAIANYAHQLSRRKVRMNRRAVVHRSNVARRLVREVPEEGQHFNGCRQMAETRRRIDHQ